MANTILLSNDFMNGSQQATQKIIEISRNILKACHNNLVALIESHRVLNSPSYEDLKSRHNLEEKLIEMRNSFISKSAQNHMFLIGMIEEMKVKSKESAECANLRQEFDFINKKIRKNWENKNVSFEALISSLSDECKKISLSCGASFVDNDQNFYSKTSNIDGPGNGSNNALRQRGTAGSHKEDILLPNCFTPQKNCEDPNFPVLDQLKQQGTNNFNSRKMGSQTHRVTPTKLLDGAKRDTVESNVVKKNFVTRYYIYDDNGNKIEIKNPEELPGGAAQLGNPVRSESKGRKQENGFDRLSPMRQLGAAASGSKASARSQKDTSPINLNKFLNENEGNLSNRGGQATGQFGEFEQNRGPVGLAKPPLPAPVTPQEFLGANFGGFESRDLKGVQAETRSVNQKQENTDRAGNGAGAGFYVVGREKVISDAIEDFCDPETKFFDVDNYPIKVEISRDGKRIYYGGDGLGFAVKAGSYIENHGMIKNQKLSILKSLPNGDLICNDFRTWDLILLDKDLVEKQRLSGVSGDMPEYYNLIKTRVTDDDKFMVWLRGQHQLSIVNTHDFSARHIHNFWNFNGSHAHATAVAINAQASKIAGIGFIPQEDHSIQTVHVFEGGDGVSIFEAAEIHPDVEAFTCLEVSKDSSTLFLGAAEKSDFSEGDAFIFALSFDENAETLNFARYGVETGFHCINSLRRHSEGNIVFAGCCGWLAVLLYTDNEFFLLNKIRNCVSGPITDITITGDTVACVSDAGKAMMLDFKIKNDTNQKNPKTAKKFEVENSQQNLPQNQNLGFLPPPTKSHPPVPGMEMTKSPSRMIIKSPSQSGRKVIAMTQQGAHGPQNPPEYPPMAIPNNQASVRQKQTPVRANNQEATKGHRKANPSFLQSLQATPGKSGWDNANFGNQVSIGVVNQGSQLNQAYIQNSNQQIMESQPVIGDGYQMPQQTPQTDFGHIGDISAATNFGFSLEQTVPPPTPQTITNQTSPIGRSQHLSQAHNPSIMKPLPGVGGAQTVVNNGYLGNNPLLVLDPKKLFDKFVVQQITIPDVELQRIQVSKTGHYIYCGKQGVRILEKVGEKYGLLRIGPNLPRFIDIKITENRELLLHSEKNSDLIKYDRDLKPIGRLQAGSEIITSLYSEDEKLFLWMLGDNSIGIVNPQTMVFDHIPNFYGQPNDVITPFTLIASPHEHKLLGLYMKDGQIWLVFVRNGDQFLRVLQSDVAKNEGTILCLETSTYKDVFFAGGGTHYNMKKGYAKIFAISFNEKLETINSLVLQGSTQRTSMGVTSIKRVKNTNICLLGANSTLFVVNFDGCKFEIINKIEEIHSWLINSIDYCPADHTVFTVSKKDKHIAKIIFTVEH